jgi:hypothetical protein
MVLKYTKGRNVAIPRHSKMYPNWDIWLENIPSGNPVDEVSVDHVPTVAGRDT